MKVRAALRGGLRLAVLLAASAATCQAEIKAVDYSNDASHATEHFSAGIPDILKMLDAKVDPGVIKAYINSSSVIYNPSATEIIALKQRGVPDEILTAMLERGAEVRVQALQAMQAMQAAASSPNSYAPTPNDNTQPQAQVAPMDSGYDSGAYSPSFYYPYNYGWNNWSWPWWNTSWWWNSWPWWNSSWWWWPSSPFFFQKNFHFHFHDGHDHGHDHGDGHNSNKNFNNRNFNNFSGRNTFASGRQAWAPSHNVTSTGSRAAFASSTRGFGGGTRPMMASRPAFSGGFRGAPMGGFRGAPMSGFHGATMGGFHGAPMGGGFHGAPMGGGFHGGGGGGGHAMGGMGGRR